MEDKLIMLLSSDWFFPHWDIVGMKTERRSQLESLQLGCRGLVRQFVADAKEYWNVSFAPERIEQTAAAFKELLEDLLIPQEVKSSVADLISSSGGNESKDSERFAMFALTERLRVAGDDVPNCPALHAQIRRVVLRISDRYEMADVEWSQIALKSATQWDRYLRELTPGQPTFLADFLVAEVLVKRPFQQLWAEIVGELTAEQQKELMSWYRAAAKRIMGIDLSFPTIV